MRLATAALLLIAWAAPAAAQSAAAKYVGRPVEDVRLFLANAPADDPMLEELLQVRPGRALSMAEVRESIIHLFSLGRFQDIQVDASDAPDGGVRLRFDLIPLRVVERVNFAGDLRLSRSLLRGAVTERYGAAPPFGRMDDVARTLEQLYRDHGYLRAAVHPVAGDTTLTFEVDAGPLARIGAVVIAGDPGLQRDAFLRRVEAAPADPYRAPRLRNHLDAYVRELRRRGFYEAVASHRATESSDGSLVDLTIDVRPGPPVTVRFEGDPLPKDRLDDLAPIEREASVDEDLLEDSETRIENYLRQQGYWKSDVTLRRQESDAALTIVFEVRRGLQYRVADVEIHGNEAVSLDELRALVPFKPGDLYLDAQLTAATSAISALYRRRGYAQVAVTSAANETDPLRAGEGRVRAAIVIVEGPRAVLGEVAITGNTAFSDAELRLAIGSAHGRPYYEPQTITDRDALLLEYLNHGFASVNVGVQPVFSEDGTRVDLTFRIEEGPQSLVDHILIVGNRRTNPQVILRELQLRSGQPFGLEAQYESQQRLSALGLFRRVRITQLTRGTGNRHDVLVTVEEAPATTIGYGGGAEASQRLRARGPAGEAQERLEFAPRGFFDIGRRNLFGKNRSVNFFTRVSLRPNDAPDDPERDGSGIGFSEYRIVGTYREPRAFGTNDLTVTAAVEQGVRSSFNFARKGVTGDLLRRVSPAVRVNGRYSFSTTRTFDERLSEEDQAAIDRLFPQVRLSAVSAGFVRDTRDDLLDPMRGTFFSSEGSLALRSLGGQVGFMKNYMQGLWFKRLPGGRPVVFATRAALGLADGFAREAPSAGDDLPEIIEDLPASERFFAGGDTTIRGYALDTVGAADTITPTGFPTGGNAILILNGELRVPVWRNLGGALFLDGGNVFRRVTHVDLGELRGSLGFGVRYRSPIGPIRVDLGFKMNRREIGGRLEPRTALHFSIGQAF